MSKREARKAKIQRLKYLMDPGVFQDHLSTKAQDQKTLFTAQTIQHIFERIQLIESELDGEPLPGYVNPFYVAPPPDNPPSLPQVLTGMDRTALGKIPQAIDRELTSLERKVKWCIDQGLIKPDETLRAHLVRLNVIEG